MSWVDFLGLAYLATILAFAGAIIFGIWQVIRLLIGIGKKR